MSSHLRLALAAVVIGVAVGIPVTRTFAQDPPAEDRGALDAPPEVAAPIYAWSKEPGADDAAAIVAAQPQGRPPSGIDASLAAWVSATNDNGDLPFMIVDKLGAQVFAFDARGQFLGSAPVLVGLARGDDTAPGIGNLKLSEISVDERTTPAGRFVAEFGESDGHGRVLWVDLLDAISLHPVMSVSPGEHRSERIKSSDPNQHRISYGCINVPATFYDEVVLTALTGGRAVIYILPDTKPIEDVFPGFAAAGAVSPTATRVRAGAMSPNPGGFIP